jgi:hypothetical protein
MIQIDEAKLKRLSLKYGIFNAKQLQAATKEKADELQDETLPRGIDYKVCYKIWRGEKANLTLSSLSLLAHTLDLIENDKIKLCSILKLSKPVQSIMPKVL